MRTLGWYDREGIRHTKVVTDEEFFVQLTCKCPVCQRVYDDIKRITA